VGGAIKCIAMGSKREMCKGKRQFRKHEKQATKREKQRSRREEMRRAPAPGEKLDEKKLNPHVEVNAKNKV